jgi:hypothetical protein
MSLIHNERVKLLASAVNTLSVAHVVTGIVAPVASIVYHLGAPGVWNSWWFLIGGAWLFAGAGLHLGAQLLLGRLK